MQLLEHPHEGFKRISYKGKIRKWLRLVPFLIEIMRFGFIVFVMMSCVAIAIGIGKLLLDLPSIAVMALYLILLGLSGWGCTKWKALTKIPLKCTECSTWMTRKHYDINARDIVFYECRECRTFLCTGFRRNNSPIHQDDRAESTSN